jgi:hypothetical protein
VPGTLASSSTVLVDVGTGFYVEKSAADAIKFYNAKVDDLSKNLGDLEKVVQGKNENLRIVEEGSYRYRSMFGLVQRYVPCWSSSADMGVAAVLRQKVIAGQAATTPAAG